MTVDEILRYLYRLGHFRNPLFINRASWNVSPNDIGYLKLSDQAVQEAIQSVQMFMSASLEPISQAIHGRSMIPDGELGPATRSLLAEPRCDCPDYYVEGAEDHWAEAVGSGSWPANCLPDFRDAHAITINIDKSGMRTWLDAVFEKQVWPAVAESYREIGLVLVRRDGDQSANLQSSFVVPDGGWIGLAIVPGQTSCSLSIWSRFDRDYQPANLVNEWMTLLKHEIGHNLRLNHTQGGVMNPSIIRGLPMSWKGVGDPSESYLRRYFGGEPVDVEPKQKFWDQQGLKDSTTGEEMWVALRPPVPRQ